MEIFNYPRQITLNHPKLVKLEKEKGQIIEEGRAISGKIEQIDLELGKIDIRLQTEEAKVDISDLRVVGDEIVKQMEVVAKEYAEKIKDVEKQIYERMKEKTDPTLRGQYENLKKTKEELETERNKKALKAQKLKDRIIPLARRVLTPYLKTEYEDFSTVKLEGDVIVGEIFSHLDEWNKAFLSKKKKLAIKDDVQ